MENLICWLLQCVLAGLSSASTMTLQHQGGPMSPEEAGNFEASPYFDIILRARKWDEAGKVEGMQMESLRKYEDMFSGVMQNVLLFEGK